MKNISLLVLFVCLTLLANGQEDVDARRDISVSGVIIDSLSMTPVEGVYIVSSRYGVVSQELGLFTIMVSHGESLAFSHIGYEPLQIKYDSSHYGDHLVVMLGQRVRILNEVIVLPYESEEAFKSKVLNTVTSLTTEHEIAKENSEAMKGLGKHGSQFPYTVNDGFKDYMKGPQGVTFLSSDPSKGFIRAIRNIVNPDIRPVNYHSPHYNGSKINPFRVRLNKIDSVASDSLIVKYKCGEN